MKETCKLDTDRAILAKWYSDTFGAAAPSALQWKHLLDRPEDEPVTLVNFFKLRREAIYERENGLSGQEAFDRYASVSMPTLAKVGGVFLMVAPFEASFIGEDEDWDIIAIGKYPNKQAVFDLFDDESYRVAYAHRVAACAKQRVMLVRN